MNQDFYFEEANPRKTKLVIACLIALFSGVVVIGFFVRGRYTLNLKKNLKFEVGTKISDDVSTFVKNKVLDEDDYTVLLSGVPIEDGVLNKVGEYSFKVKYKSITKTGHISVVDTVAPEVTVEELTVGVDEEFDRDDFVTVCDDYSKPCKVEYEGEGAQASYDKEGIYDFKIKVSDAVGNSVKKDVKLIVKKNYNLTEAKESDLKIDHIEPNFSDWNNQMLIKFDKAYDPNSIDDTDGYAELMEVSSRDFHNYIDELYINNLIVDSQIIEVYNKYGFIIGYAIRLELDNGLKLYCQNR